MILKLLTARTLPIFGAFIGHHANTCIFSDNHRAVGVGVKFSGITNFATYHVQISLLDVFSAIFLADVYGRFKIIVLISSLSSTAKQTPCHKTRPKHVYLTWRSSVLLHLATMLFYCNRSTDNKPNACFPVSEHESLAKRKRTRQNAKPARR